jgi:WxL domain surface cell wall-binding
MSHSMSSTRKRLTALAGASALIVGGGVAAVAFSAGTASAAPCADAGTAGGDLASCTVAGNATFAAGTLTMEAPPGINWGTVAAPLTLTGAAVQVPDTVAGADLNQYEVLDSSGTGAGWTVTASASTFTGTLAGPDTLPDAAALSFNGSDTLPAAATAPSVACADGVPADCVVPTSNADVTYPVVMATATGGGPAYRIADAAVGSGIGSILYGATVPGTFWLTVPPTALVDTYTSVITFAVTSGPGGGTT